MYVRVGTKVANIFKPFSKIADKVKPIKAFIDVKFCFRDCFGQPGIDMSTLLNICCNMVQT